MAFGAFGDEEFLLGGLLGEDLLDFCALFGKEALEAVNFADGAREIVADGASFCFLVDEATETLTTGEALDEGGLALDVAVGDDVAEGVLVVDDASFVGFDFGDEIVEAELREVDQGLEGVFFGAEAGDFVREGGRPAPEFGGGFFVGGDSALEFVDLLLDLGLGAGVDVG